MVRARPTIRCLWDEMIDGLRPDSTLESILRDQATQRRLPHVSMRLGEVSHPIMDDVRSFYDDQFADHLDTGGDVPRNRTFSLGFSKSGRSFGMRWYKARSDDHVHMRGLVCRVEDTFWLGWVGDRNGDYWDFNARKDIDQNTSHFEPEPRDFARLRLEEAWVAERDAERATAVWVLGAFVDAWRQTTVDEPATCSAAHPSGFAEVTVSTSLIDSELAEVEIDVVVRDSSWFDRLSEQLPSVIPGDDYTDWKYTIINRDATGGRFRLDDGMDPDRLDRLVKLVDEYGVEAVVADPVLAADPFDGKAHLVTSADQERGLLEGALIRSVCGHLFVPMENPDGKVVCTECAVIVQVLQEADRDR